MSSTRLYPQLALWLLSATALSAKTEINLALNAPITVTGVAHYLDHAPANATDGSPSTRWWSNDIATEANNVFIEIDLGSVQPVDRVDIHWGENDFARRYELLGRSSTSEAWTSIHTHDTETGGYKRHAFADTPLRYLQLRCIDSWGWWMQIFELEAFTNSIEINWPNAPLLTFCFDDGTLPEYSNGFPLFQARGMPATMYTLAGVTQYNGYDVLTQAQLQEMHAAGWEIGSHGMTHTALTDLDEAGITYELTQSRQILEGWGFPVNGFAVPYGLMNETVQTVAESQYEYMRPTLPGYNRFDGHPDDFDLYALKSRWVTNDKSIDVLKSWVDDIVAQKSWLIFMGHNVLEDASGEQFAMNTADLAALLDYVQAQGVQVETVAQAVARIQDARHRLAAPDDILSVSAPSATASPNQIVDFGLSPHVDYPAETVDYRIELDGNILQQGQDSLTDLIINGLSVDLGTAGAQVGDSLKVSVTPTLYGSVFDTSQFTVNIVADAGNFSEWYQQSVGGTEDASNDQDGDGLSALVEYAFDLNPSQAERDPAGRLPALSRQGNALELTFTRLESRTDLDYELEVSTDLSSWQTAARSQAGGALTDLGGQTLSINESGSGQIQATVTLSLGQARYARVRIRLSP